MAMHKVSALEGALLDAAVAKALNIDAEIEAEVCMADPEESGFVRSFAPSQAWQDGGPILERHRIDLEAPMMAGDEWGAVAWPALNELRPGPNAATAMATGPTPLVAAMRAFVEAVLGADVDLP